MNGNSDETLMQLVQNGDLDKASILFTRYQQKVYSYFNRNTLNKEISMDLSQNTFYRMLNYRSAYKYPMLFKSWLFGIAHHVLLDQFNNKHDKTNSIELVKTEQLIDNEPDTFENEALHHALSTLEPIDRELLVMSRFENIKYIDIAEIMNLSESAVKVKIHRAIKKLRQIFFEENITRDIRIQPN